ncbi:signal transduction histidine kinase [Glaciihabitans tibetensis]|uniref:histidine kinase n=1 Tax=Glaciihabitans tibetensis TaxID=1266600 RepID=A0A2T0V375_9MICO|nr:HAMP domain-containing sensor histidine kinase [Glaciihabitans tibetensis]PRY64622.1 signal transduction histidine kinase [Glaciihabitans tibetensis]
MPDLEREIRDYVDVVAPRHRLAALFFAQLPFAGAMAALIWIFRADASPILADPEFAVGLGITAVATVAAVVAQWQRIPSGWLSIIPLLDVVAVIFIRGAAAEQHPDVGLFVVAPVIWLALLTPLPVMIAGFVGLEIAVLYPLLAHTPPESLYDWIVLILKPGLLMAIAVAVRINNSRLRSRQLRTEELASELQSALVASERRETTMRTVLDSITAAIVLFDAHGKLSLANDFAGTMSDLARFPLDGSAVDPDKLLLYRPDRTTPVPMPGVTTVFELAKKLSTDTVYWIGAPGNQRAVVTTATPLGEGSELHGGTVAVVYDVTNLIEAVRVRDDFVSSTSHELRTPLTSILGYLDLIDAPALGIEMEIEVIERNARRLLGMISDLLDVKVQSAVQRREVNLAVLVGSTAHKRSAEAAAAGIALSYTPADASYVTPPLAVVDAVAIARVVDNLLSNAIKFSRRGDSVTVTLEVDDSVAVIAVVDTGVGISTEDQAHVFEQFFRAPSAKVGAIPGAGLGLTVTRSILEAHNATVTVESVVGQGTTMVVVIPRWPSQFAGEH